MKKLRFSFVFGLFIVLLVSLHAFTANPDLKGLPLNEYLAHLDQLMPGLLHEYKVPGTAIAVIHDGQVVYVKGFGVADRKIKTPVTADTVFQVASISKSFAALGVMKLVQEGKIELDKPVDTYLTRWHLPASKYDHSGVTIRRLLSHTAGLSLGGYPGYRPDRTLPTIEESLSGKTRGAGAVKVKFEPGTAWSYSGGGYTLLQLVIEEVTGQTFADYITKEVLTPYGMLASSYTWNPAVTATGYDMYGKPFYNYLFTEKAAAGLYSTATDMAKMVVNSMKIYNGTPVDGALTKENLELMYTPVMGSYGFGHIAYRLPNGNKFVNHSGSNFGWKAFYGFFPETGDGIVILTNSDNGTNLFFRTWGDWFDWLGIEHADREVGGFSQFMQHMTAKLVEFLY